MIIKRNTLKLVSVINFLLYIAILLLFHNKQYWFNRLFFWLKLKTLLLHIS